MNDLSQFDELPDGALVRLPVVRAITGLARNTIWRRANDGSFPRAVKIPGTRAAAWRVGDLRRWLSSIERAH